MGYGSRKEVKELCKKKKVTLNGTYVKDASQHIDPITDHIQVNGGTVSYKPYVYIMLNKPKGVISATEDIQDKTVVDLLQLDIQQYNPFPVGRLDKDTEGLLLLTNDGELAHVLTSPKKKIEKTYFAKIEGFVTEEDITKFASGVVLDDGYETKPGKLVVKKEGEISEVELTITEGKFHQVKRMFKSVGKKVVYLKRIRMGMLELDNSLRLGDYRELTNNEVNALRQKNN